MAAKRKKRNVATATRAPGEPKRTPAQVKRTPAEVWSRVEKLKGEVRRELKRLRAAGTRKLAVVRARGPHVVGVAVLAVAQGVLLVTAPFVVLVRGAVWLYQG